MRGGRKTLVHTAIWLGAITGLLTAFAFRDEAAVVIQEIRAELMPSLALARAAGDSAPGARPRSPSSDRPAR